MKKFLTILLVLVMALTIAGCAKKEEKKQEETPVQEGTKWPEKTVTIVVPFNNGGDSDFNARVLTDFLAVELGQTFVIENMSGSGGSIGSKAVADAANDGYTILSNHNSLQISYASGISTVNFDNFEVVGMYAQNPGDVIAVSSKSGITNLDQLVAASKEKKMTVATNIGATTQVESFMLGEYANVTQVDVGAVSDKIVALLGEQVDIIIGPYGNIQPYVESGDFNILANCAPERAKGYSDVPTCKEQGYDIEWQTSFFLAFPKGTDQQIVDKFAAAVKKIVTTNADYAAKIMEAYKEYPVWHDTAEALEMYKKAEATISKYTLTSLGQ